MWSYLHYALVILVFHLQIMLWEREYCHEQLHAFCVHDYMKH